MAAVNIVSVAYRNSKMFSSYLECQLCIRVAVGLFRHLTYSGSVTT